MFRSRPPPLPFHSMLNDIKQACLTHAQALHDSQSSSGDDTQQEETKAVALADIQKTLSEQLQSHYQEGDSTDDWKEIIHAITLPTLDEINGLWNAFDARLNHWELKDDLKKCNVPIDGTDREKYLFKVLSLITNYVQGDTHDMECSIVTICKAIGKTKKIREKQKIDQKAEKQRKPTDPYSENRITLYSHAVQ